ncbi:MAG: ABC transporter ATP-binding protein [Methanomicrobiales archaeon]|nr:ABC transporter ATP-binding protein [Methanomicrobiales archaeon]
MIALEGVSLRLGEFSLREVSLTVGRGEFVFLVGPSGAGKTLLLEVIAGLHPGATGRVRIGEKDMTGVPPEGRKVALVYQDYALFPHLTVRENVAFGPGVRGLSKERIGTLVGSLLDRFGLTGLGDRYPDTLSGGERQRVTLARALATEPGVLLLDEPFAAVDPGLRARFMRELADLQREQGLTVLQVSHARDEAFALGDRVALISAGRVLEAGPVEQVFHRPSSREAAAIAGIANLVDGVVVGRQGDLAIIELPGGSRIRAGTGAPEGSRVTTCIPDGEITLMAGNLRGGPGASVLHGRVTSVVHGEDFARVEISCGFPLVARIPSKEATGVIAPGAEVSATVLDRDVHVIVEAGGVKGP